MQADKKEWNLASDEKLFDKLKALEDNVVASTHLVHNSVNELNKAFNSASTTLDNSINAFNQLNFNKFVENVVEETDAQGAGMLFGGGVTMMADETGQTAGDQTTILGDLKSEDEKLTEALEIALEEIANAK